MKKTFKKIAKLSAILLGSLLIILLISSVIMDGYVSRYDYVDSGQTRKVNGLDTYYREQGTGDQTLLFIHGFLGSSYDFNEIMDELSSEYHVIAVDQIGYGLSAKPLDYDYSKEQSAIHIKQFMDELGIEHATVLAHSMGGEVALHLAYLEPEFVDHLILFGSMGTVTGEQPALPLVFYPITINNYLVQRIVIKSAYEQQAFVTNDSFNEMWYVNRTIPSKVMREYSIDSDLGLATARLPEIETDTLLLWGREDQFVPLEKGIELQESLTNSKMIIYENTGHHVFEEQLEAVTSDILTYLKK